MAEIQNLFSWSFSRQQTFDHCLRQYYFRYYQFWGGWSPSARKLPPQMELQNLAEPGRLRRRPDHRQHAHPDCGL